MQRKKLLIPLLLMVGILLAACETVTISFDEIDEAPDQMAAPQAVSVDTAPPSTLTNTEWHWSTLAESDPAAQSVVPNPDQYTVTFQDDGSVLIQADCNNGSGTYTRAVDSDALTIEIGPLTQAFCGEESLDTQFLALLAEVGAFAQDGDQLALQTTGDATMGFADGGPSALEQEVGLSPAQIRIDAQELPYAWQANLVPGTPYDASTPPGPMGLPGHLQINFGVTNPADQQPGTPVMYIIPVAAYETQWAENENDGVATSIAAIYSYTLALPQPAPTGGVPILPVEEITGVNDVAVQVGEIEAMSLSATKDGYRFIGRFAQDANPITRDGVPMQYIYQGFTNDGEYLVSFFYPVTSDQLPSNADVNDAFAEAQAEEGGAEAFIANQVEELNALDADAWDPTLDTLDAVVGSLQIDGMPSNAVVGQVWQLADEAEDAGEPYTLLFEDGDTFSYTTDCNNGFGRYIVNSLAGVTGPITMNPEASTRAACPPESGHDAFVAALTAAQDFNVRPGAEKTLELLGASNDPLLFTYAGPVAEVVPPEPEPTATAEPPTATPVPPTATPEPPTETPTPGQPLGTITAPRGVNIRSGPSTAYPAIDSAEFGDVISLVGRSADGLWWATPVPASPSGLGWISAQYVDASNAGGLPILPAPPLPTPTSTPTPVPTATPPPAAQIRFTVDNTAIDSGECTTLRWSVENVQAVWVYPQGQPFDQYPVPGQGTQQVCPESTTTYEMRVQLVNGATEFRQVTVQVRPANPLANTTWQVGRFGGFGVPLPGTTLTAEFGGVGTFNANAGCNSYGGSYSLSGNNIRISQLAGTQIFCSDEINQQETQYITALQAATTYELRDGGNTLVLFDASGAEVLSFVRLVATPF